jgi:hypothetical protein
MNLPSFDKLINVEFMEEIGDVNAVGSYEGDVTLDELIDTINDMNIK